MIHTLFQQKVKLEPVKHKYFDNEGKEYLSVSALLKLLSEPFEESSAYKRATPETRNEWKAKGKASADHGTRIHEAIELYSDTGQILLENKEYEEVIKSVNECYKGYNKSYNEVCLYNEHYRVAGTTDKICAISNRKDCEVDLADFKNLGKDLEYWSKYKNRLYKPLEHLDDCNFVKYNLQLSIYAYFFELLTGRKVRQLWIHVIPTQNMTGHQKIPVIYLKNDVKLLLEANKGNILQKLGVTAKDYQVFDPKQFEEEMF